MKSSISKAFTFFLAVLLLSLPVSCQNPGNESSSASSAVVVSDSGSSEMSSPHSAESINDSRSQSSLQSAESSISPAPSSQHSQTPTVPVQSSSTSAQTSSEPVNEKVSLPGMDKAIGVSFIDINLITAESIALLKQAGVSYIKIHAGYPFQQFDNTPSYYYTKVKNIIILAKSCGMNVLCQTFTPGGNSYDASVGNVVWKSSLPKRFGSFKDDSFYEAAEVATEYMAKDLKDYVDIWLVSNEPDINVFTGEMTIPQIARYISAGASGLKKGNPDAKVGVNMFVSVNFLYSLQIVSEIYGDDSKLDFIGLDSYFGTLVAGDPQTWTKYIKKFSDETDLPVVITEYGYSSAVYDPSLIQDVSGKNYNSPVCRDKKFSTEWLGHTRSEESQALYIDESLKLFAENPVVVGSFWFQAYDFYGPCWECGEELCPMNSSWGLLRPDNTAKPSYNAMKNAYNKYYK